MSSFLFLHDAQACPVKLTCEGTLLQMCSANPSLGPLHTQVFHFARELSDGLKPQTAAYAEIWLDQKQVVGEAVKDVEPLYGEYYLPRKFKIAIAVPPYNDVDVFCHDLGYIAILDDDKQLLGFNVTIGGGMGVTQCVSLVPHVCLPQTVH